MATAYNARSRLTAERWFYTGMAAAMLVTIFVGFARTYYLLPFMAAPPFLKPATLLVHLHGAIFTAWSLLFMAQVSLVATGRRDIHRLMGGIGLALAIGMIVTGLFASLYGVGRASGPPFIPPMSFLAVPLFAVPAFGILILTALKERNNPQTHKRLMLLSMIVMMSPAFGRMSWFPGPVGIILMPNLFLIALIVWDLKTRGRIHRATAWGGALVVVAQVLPALIWETRPWLNFARWATGLVA